MKYDPGFERNPKGNFDIENNYVSIQSGSEAYLLEDELNELQWIQYEQRAQSIRSTINSGIIFNEPSILDTNEAADNALYIKSYNNHDVNINTLLFGIKNYIPVNLNGYIFKLCGTYNKNISGQINNYNNILIDLYDGSKITSGTKNELVYLEVWFENVNSVENNMVNKYGGLTNDYTEFQNDERLQLETTRRIQLKWAIKTKIDCDSLLDVSPLSNNSVKYVKATGSIGKNYSDDSNLYICDVKLSKPEKSIDNMYYAIPLFLIKRTNSQIQLSNVTPLYNVSQQYSSKFVNNTITFGSNEIILKNNSGTEMELKNPNGDYVDLKLKNLTNNVIVTKDVVSNIYKINDVTTNKKVSLTNTDQTVELKDAETNSLSNLTVNVLKSNEHETENLITSGISIVDKANNKTTKLLNNNGDLQVLDSSNTHNGGYGDLTVGNLYIKGDTTIIEAETVTVADNIIVLNSDVTSTTNPTEDAGIEINRGNSTAASLLWDEDNDVWTAGLLNSEDIILLKNSPTITTPTIENRIVFKSTNPDKILTINANDSSTTLSSIKFNGSASGRKLWSITTDNNTNNIATINANNVLCNNIGEVARVAMEKGVAKPANNLAKGNHTLFIDYQNKKIYFDNSANNWIEVGRPADIADCDSNFHYDNVAPTGSTRLNYNGYFYATRVYNAVYNDYAEYFEKGDKTVEPGDVIVCSEYNDNEYVKSNTAYSNLVVGVCSDSYGHILGGEGKESDEDNFIPLGLSGRVNVKVVGDVKKGDLLVTSEIPGVAMKSEKYAPGTVIGKALENHNGNQINRIKMLIMNI